MVWRHLSGTGRPAVKKAPVPSTATGALGPPVRAEGAACTPKAGIGSRSGQPAGRLPDTLTARPSGRVRTTLTGRWRPQRPLAVGTP